MEQNKTFTSNEDMEIDLLELLRAFWHRLWLIVLAAVAGGGLAWAYSRYVLTPQYTSTAMLYVLSKETTLTSLADLQLGSQLTKDYQVLITSRPVLEEVIGELELDISYRKLREKISVENPADTRFLNVTVVDPDPRLAKQIVDEVAARSSDYIGDIMEMIPPKLIEDGEVAAIQSSPSNEKNAVLGALLAMVAVCGVIALGVILNDTVRTEEDVEKYLGITVLASIPEHGGEKREEKPEKRKPVKYPSKGKRKGKKR